MSAFAGLLALSNPLPLDLPERLSSALNSPGLESARHWSTASIFLAHCLRISAPEDRYDQQPRRHPEHPLALVFDGYLINRYELIQSLNLPVSAKSWPDSALALEALIRWSEQAPEHLLGDFALAAWDPSTQKLLLARDGVGQRPLYFHQNRHFFAFATTPTALLAIPGVPWEINEERFALSLADLPADPHSTFHKHLRSLPAGTVATLRDGRLTQRRYWRPERRKELILAREDDYVEAARELLDRAVQDCLRVEGPVFSALTGGLDSSAVTVTALKHLPGNTLTALTSLPAEGLALPDTPRFYASERPYVERIAAQTPGLTTLCLPGPPLHRWDTDWTSMFRSTGVPWRNVMNLAWMGPIRDHVREQGGRVLLSGALGNITLSWDGQGTLPALLRRGRWLHALRQANDLARHSNLAASRARQIWRTTFSPFIPEALQHLLSKSIDAEWERLTALSSATRMTPPILQALKSRRHASRMPGWQLRQYCIEERQTTLESMGLVRALHGFEVRDPMADRRLLEFCLSLPDSLYLKDGVSRRLARLVTADRLPAEIVNNPRRGLQCPEYLYRLNGLRPLLTENLEQLEKSSLARQLLDLKRMKALLSQWPSDPWHPEYLTVLHRGLHFGQFLLWAESGRAHG